MCLATVFEVGVLVGLVAWIVCWKMFVIICCFLFPRMFVATVFAVGVLVGLVAWSVCWKMFLILFCFCVA